MAPGGGILLVPFTRGVVCCLFLTTSTVFCLGVARIHMFILSVLSVGFFFALGLFQKEYKKLIDKHEDVTVAAPISTKKSTRAPTVSKAKRED
eukprot:364753_1